MSKINIELKKNAENKYPGVYVFGRLLGQGEKPIALGVANYFTGLTSAGGKLLLTNKSLSFSAHGINVGKKEVSIIGRAPASKWRILNSRKLLSSFLIFSKEG